MTGVLLMAYGAAASLDEIPQYLADIRRGRPADAALIEDVRRRYERIGGRSPLPEITAAQARALQAALGPGFRVGFGMRHSAPRIADALGPLASGCETLVGLPLTPFASRLSTGAYFDALAEAAKAHPALKVVRAASFHDHPRLVAALAERAQDALSRAGEGAALLLTAHSLPSRIEAEGDPYARQLRETAALVAGKLGLSRWHFAYQSRGRTGEEWLGPEAGDVIARLAAEGTKALALAPIGFVSEHLETLYDDDVQYREQAQRLGLRFSRAAALNDHPGFIDALADAARKAVGTL